MTLLIITTILANFIFFSSCVPLNNYSDIAFELSVIHLNDFHARFEQISSTSTSCKIENDSCIGGFSRVYTAVNQLARSRPNTIILNGGDNFQGTLWYTIYRWNVTQYFFNLLPFDAYTLGNHEFDHGIKGLVPFIKALKAPVLVGNIDDREEPELQGLYKKSIVIERDGRRIGIVGVISQHTNELSNTGKLKFLDESASVNREAERLVSEENIDTIIVLSHCGYEADQVIALYASPKISVIVGAHSHTFLYTGEPLPGPDKPKGSYPTIVTHEDGRVVLIVQAAALSKYVGNLTIQYDNKGKVISWFGAPIYLNNIVKQDVEINKKLEWWKNDIDSQGNRILGSTNVLLQHTNCRYSECNLGNFIADAMVSEFLNNTDTHAWTDASIAIINSGGIKTSILPGNITFSDLTLTLPFGNTFDVGEIQGKFLLAALEYSAGNVRRWGGFDMNLLQVSGLRVVYNVTKPLGSKLESVRVLCRECAVPSYESLKPEKYYRIVINSFLVGGGEGHVVLAKNLINRRIGRTDIDVLEKYIKSHSPVIQGLEERIQIIY